MAKKKKQLPIAQIAVAAVAVGGGIYAYRNRDTLRQKFAAIVGRSQLAIASVTGGAVKTVVAPAALTVKK